MFASAATTNAVWIAVSYSFIGQTILDLIFPKYENAMRHVRASQSVSVVSVVCVNVMESAMHALMFSLVDRERINEDQEVV